MWCNKPVCRYCKNSAWKVYQDNSRLLHGLGQKESPEPDVLSSAEAFVCKLYDPGTSSKLIQEVRSSLFLKCRTNIDYLPPTQDALIQHIKRSHYQAYIWNQCLKTIQQLPSPLTYGWCMEDNKLKPLLMTVEHLTPKSLKLKHVVACAQKNLCVALMVVAVAKMTGV